MARRTNLRMGKAKTYVNLAALNWATAIEGLPTGPKTLLCLLARYSDKFGVSWHKQEAMARELGCTARSLRNHLKVLVQLGLVRRIGQSWDGRQAPNIYHFFAWPGRALIPQDGHPLRGRSVSETAETRQRHGWQRPDFPPAEEESAEHNNESSFESITVRKGVVEPCLDALGVWATEGNRDRLRKDFQTLIDLLSIGYDLADHILPALRKMAASDPAIPLIRSWQFFVDAIEQQARAGAAEDPSAVEKIESRAGDTGSGQSEEEAEFLKLLESSSGNAVMRGWP
ncbi:helix-turn-helix domain-containing protein [Paracoccus litorisediminis]|uniref:Helix-turn-helix domain-containing protein n=1 Tax=Paracoccus litorisediminis TaxID=2006130 RepID=A0A844HQU1_9RHOB|nr:helix-turn-helix domain-containing protein [Paracoccus litorisediminis]MTH60041.1 hypothetical protein [Paracoccus litorisediminis]